MFSFLRILTSVYKGGILSALFQHLKLTASPSTSASFVVNGTNSALQEADSTRSKILL